MKRVHVAAAILCRHNKILAVQRGYGERAGLWEFPGGKLEANETAEAACVRELTEELGVTVHIEDLYEQVCYSYPEMQLIMDCFVCSLDDDAVLVLADNQRQVAWLAPHELPILPWMPADVALVERIAHDSRFVR
ncbi:(deoxy)nucleoside triphosphate pyrophosphohydrolase [Collinsella sp. zg1085]|uniref:(deoxy)nucleoside triphosphate pyrophosphohydrolase n=1 Tax=Collinsella sp. zg1085 TaxID=2844380 RepID=UPI00209AB824|nr:(deoxy)nucleoside triphosphate pyrophosphohydrolase [Collinsella sp. zg1085]